MIHFDLPEYWTDLSKLRQNLNRKLTEIRFKHITKVSHDFHARFSAKKRLYRYVFKSTRPSLFERRYISFYENFDAALLKTALQHFEGEHDFAFFHKTGSPTHTTRREIYKTAYVKRGEYHYIYFQANGFLRSQVRMMVEGAMLCAKGILSLEQLKEQLACQIKHSSRPAPPEGLYLAHINYKGNR